MGFSWLPIIALQASSHSWPISWGFRGIVVDPLKTKLVAFSGGSRAFFLDIGAPPAVENMRNALPWKALKRTSFLARCHPYNQMFMQADSDHKIATRTCSWCAIFAFVLWHTDCLEKYAYHTDKHQP